MLAFLGANGQLCMLGYFLALLSSSDFFLKLNSKKKTFRNTIKVSKQVGFRSGSTFCRA